VRESWSIFLNREHDSRSPRRLALTALALLTLTPRAPAEEAPRFFRIGTAAATGTYFQLGAEIANAISKPAGARDCERGGNCGVEGLVAVALATDGSVANALAVGQGQLEAAFVQADVARWAYLGKAPAFAPGKGCKRGAAPPVPTLAALLAKTGAIRNLRAIAALYPETVHVVARIGSAVRTLGDLKGKKVVLGEPGSGTLAEARLVLAAIALPECSVKAGYQSLAEAAALIEQGKLDALFIIGGPPVPAIADAAAVQKLRLVAVAGKARDALLDTYPFLTAATIPGATYPGIDAATATVAVPALFIVSAAVPEELVYGITKALWQDATRRLLDRGHPAGRAIRLETALDGVAIPLHPGAARYYAERGMALPASPPP
jgi:hypothetical protein